MFIKQRARLVCLFFLSQIVLLGHASNLTSTDIVRSFEGPDISSDSLSYAVYDADNVELVGYIGGSTYSAAVKGGLVYVGEGFALTILDISNEQDPLIVGKTLPFPGIVRDVTVVGDYAYVANSWGGLRIINVADPTTPVEVGYYKTPSNANGVTVAGEYAYVADEENGLRIINVADPTTPIEVGFFNAQTPSYTNGVTVAGDYAYIADGWGLRIINVADPTTPAEVGFYDTSDWARGVAVVGNYAYVIARDAGAGLQIIDVTDPTTPTEAGHYDTQGFGGNVAVVEDYAYIANNDDLLIINVADPNAPSETGYYKTPGNAVDVTVAGNYAYVADEECGLRIINASDRADLTEAGFYDTPSDAYDVAVAGEYAYVADRQNGLRIINVADPAIPIETGFYDTPNDAFGVAVAGEYAYVVDGYYGELRIINVADPTAPIEAGFYDTPGYAQGVTVAGEYAYVADGRDGLRIINVADPAAPIETGYHNRPDEADTAGDVAVAGEYAYVGEYLYGGLRIINVTDLTAPIEVGRYPIGDGAHDVAVAGKYVYVAAGDSGLIIINVTDPTAPTMVGNRASGWAGGVAVAGDYAYVADQEGGLIIINVADPAAPTQAGFYNTPGHAFGVAVDGNYAYVTAGGGLYILKYKDPASHGKIVIDKVTNPANDPQAFAFTLAGGPDELDLGFTLRNATDPWESILLKPGVYSVTESIPTGWIQSTTTCDDGSDPNKIKLAARETVTCTFTNTNSNPPVADFNASPAGGVPPLEVFFENLSTGAIDECLWEYGDDVKIEVCDDPSHTYNQPGTFSVSLTVKGSGGEDTMAKADYITVYEPVKADFSASPEVGALPLTVDFTNLSTGDIDECLWDFGDNESSDVCEDPAHTYNEAGTYTVGLTVKGPGGEDTKTVKQCVKVGNQRVFLPGVMSKK